MSLLDLIGGRPPKPYDPRLDHAALPDPRKEKSLRAHVEECARRYQELRGSIQDNVIEMHYLRRLLWAVIGLLILNKVIDLGQLSGVLN